MDAHLGYMYFVLFQFGYDWQKYWQICLILLFSWSFEKKPQMFRSVLAAATQWMSTPSETSYYKAGSHADGLGMCPLQGNPLRDHNTFSTRTFICLNMHSFS